MDEIVMYHNMKKADETTSKENKDEFNPFILGFCLGCIFTSTLFVFMSYMM